MHSIRKRARTWTALAAFLAGGTLFATCQMRVRDALVEGSKNAVFQVLEETTTDLIDFTENVN